MLLVSPVDPARQHPAMLRAVRGLKAADSPSTSFFLLSNSNTVYIDTILKVRPPAYFIRE